MTASLLDESSLLMALQQVAQRRPGCVMAGPSPKHGRAVHCEARQRKERQGDALTGTAGMCTAVIGKDWLCRAWHGEARHGKARFFTRRRKNGN